MRAVINCKIMKTKETPQSIAAAIERLNPGSLALIGVPSDTNSSFLRGAAEAPLSIRRALYSDATNLCTENGTDLSQEQSWVDVSDLVLDARKDESPQIESAARSLLEKGAHLLALGGDHAITYPLVKAHSDRYGKLTILHLDAHPDLYDVFEGNRYSHACPFSRIMEDGLAVRLVQAGIRTMTPHQREQARRFGVEVIEMRRWDDVPLSSLCSPLYLSLDLDVLDPGFAPGISHYEPGGATPRQVIEIIQGLPVPPVGADIVELNPRRDIHDMTAAVAAKCLKELIAKMLGT